MLSTFQVRDHDVPKEEDIVLPSSVPNDLPDTACCLHEQHPKRTGRPYPLPESTFACGLPFHFLDYSSRYLFISSLFLALAYCMNIQSGPQTRRYKRVLDLISYMETRLAVVCGIGSTTFFLSKKDRASSANQRLSFDNSCSAEASRLLLCSSKLSMHC